jgi:hypothetical protein
MKYAACKSEMERLEDLGQVQDLRRELQVACTTKEELGAIVQGIICVNLVMRKTVMLMTLPVGERHIRQ